MTEILVACDRASPQVGHEIETLFREAGYKVYQAPACKNLLAGRGADADLVIIDATRDGRRGLCLASSYRTASSVGIVVIHHADADADLVQTLEVGADDVLVQPFRHRELLARVKSLLRRMNLDKGDQLAGKARRGIQFKGWFLDLERRQLVCEATGGCVPLTTAEYNMLTVFAQNSCRVLSRDDLSIMALGRPHSMMARSLDAQVARLRKRLSTNKPGIAYIKSVRSVGYIFCNRTYDVY
ncbi:winged helix-turn-helix domain-containing protein [Methylorubrum podarium]|uniref:Response regulator transcription factor n=1 Tax=Methylorubrum podarium TaxID=200476 RepID=A0ABV1QIJ7_9HYPH|nr:response regulator transcription factor [Methylorubrum podarium]GJE72609.1 Aerobic respiration control protein ArcA [Methylorubrum podarium]